MCVIEKNGSRKSDKISRYHVSSIRAILLALDTFPKCNRDCTQSLQLWAMNLNNSTHFYMCRDGSVLLSHLFPIKCNEMRDIAVL